MSDPRETKPMPDNGKDEFWTEAEQVVVEKEVPATPDNDQTHDPPVITTERSTSEHGSFEEGAGEAALGYDSPPIEGGYGRSAGRRAGDGGPEPGGGINGPDTGGQ